MKLIVIQSASFSTKSFVDTYLIRQMLCWSTALRKLELCCLKTWILHRKTWRILKMTWGSWEISIPQLKSVSFQKNCPKWCKWLFLLWYILYQQGLLVSVSLLQTKILTSHVSGELLSALGVRIQIWQDLQF